jgi:predicted aldo/keto reductase-like oxidoreductase
MFWTSLKRTGAGYFDHYLLHNISVARADDFDNFGIWDFLAEQKEKGLIKHLGFSYHDTADYLDEYLTKHPQTEFVQLQINYADWDNRIIQSRECYEVARKHGKPVIVMEPVKGGALANLPGQVSDILKQANPSASLASWAVRYAVSLEGIITVLSGMSTLEQMQDNVSYMEHFVPLGKEEDAIIEKAQKALAEFPQVPCTDCKYCLKDCPKDIAIPGILKVMNDYLIYKDIAAGKFLYGWETLKKAKASECTACGQCEKVCPQSVSVIRELSKAVGIFEG